MQVLKHLANWLIWMLIPAAFTFILSVVFSFSYIECVHSAPFVVFYFLYFIMATAGYLISVEDYNSNEPLSFFK